MSLIKESQSILDQFQEDIKKSKALSLHVYNEMFRYNIKVRSIAPPSFQQKIKIIMDELNALRLSSYKDNVPEIWKLLIQDSKLNALSDADIDWINKLSTSELFAIWYFCRIAMPIQTEENLTDIIEYLQLPAQLISKIAETTLIFNPRYTQLALDHCPRDHNDMKSCVLDFVSCWSNYRSKLDLLSYLKHITDLVRSNKFYSFIQNSSAREQEILWSYLRTHKDMIGNDCESMSSFGAARIIGVFQIWPAPDEYKNKVESEARKHLSNTIYAQKALKVRKNITLSEHANTKLLILSGGERSVSAYIEELIMKQELTK